MTSTPPALQPLDLAACCAPVTDGVVNDETAETLGRMFKALSDPSRVKLLSMVAAGSDDGTCACDMTGPVGLSQPTVSHHLKILVEAGLVTREQRGKWAYYRIAPEVLRSLAAALEPVSSNR